jgi:hypothetical protein
MEMIVLILLWAGFAGVLVRLYFRARYLLALPPQPFDPMRKDMIEGMPVLGNSGGGSGDFGSDHHSHGDHGGDSGGHGH